VSKPAKEPAVHQEKRKKHTTKQLVGKGERGEKRGPQRGSLTKKDRRRQAWGGGRWRVIWKNGKC